MNPRHFSNYVFSRFWRGLLRRLVRKNKTLFFAVLLLSACSLWLAEKSEPPTDNFTATLLNIADGDTITILKGGEKRRVRLYGIDAPELKQAYGIEAREFLKSILSDQLQLKCQPKRDRYKRWVCDVYNQDGTWINLALIQNGYAWHYTAYSKNQELATAETSARTNHKGLWQTPNPIPPWLYRQQNKN